MKRLLFSWCAMLCVMSTVHASELTSVDLVPKTDWRYFYNSAGVDDAELNAALEDSGFYSSWTSSDFTESTIAGMDWQGGTLPIGQRNIRFDWPQELVTEINLPMVFGPRRTVFLRRTFTVPDGISGLVGLEFLINWQAPITGWQHADFNADGIVDAKDLNLLGQNWQESLTRLPGETVNLPNAIPEPMSYLLLLAGGLGLTTIARRVPRSTITTIVAAAIFLWRG